MEACGQIRRTWGRVPDACAPTNATANIAELSGKTHFGENRRMRYVSASEAKQRLAAVLDTVQREPVTIRRRNREVAVVLSPLDYRRLTATNVAEFQRFCDRVSEAAKARGLTEEELGETLQP